MDFQLYQSEYLMHLDLELEHLDYTVPFLEYFKQKLENKPLTIVGSGNQKRDFLFVTDVTKAFAAAMSKRTEIYNLGANKPQTINKLAKLISNNFEYIPKRPGEPNCTWANINKIKSHLNWKPLWDLSMGSEMIKQIDYWKKAPLWDKKSIKKATKQWFSICNE